MNNAPRLLLIGNEFLDRLVASLLARSNYQLESYRCSAKPFVNWSKEAIRTYIRDNGSRFNGVLVDFNESQGAKAAKDAGYDGPVIGIVSHPRDQVPYADRNIMISVSDAGESSELKKTLDSIFSQ
jgi:hypothetical protein